jgi:plastocyanin
MRRHFLAPILLAGVSACGGSTSPANGPTASTQVDVRDNVFVPSAITAATSETITWTWRGATGHNVTFEDGQGSSGTQVSGTHARAFAAPGTYRYRCTIHSTNFASGMVGSVIAN